VGNSPKVGQSNFLTEPAAKTGEVESVMWIKPFEFNCYIEFSVTKSWLSASASWILIK